MHVVRQKGHWGMGGKPWMRIPILHRTGDYLPQMEEGGPDISLLNGQRITFKSFVGVGIATINDDYLSSLEKETSVSWTGTTTFLTTSTSSGSSSSDSVAPKKNDYYPTRCLTVVASVGW